MLLQLDLQVLPFASFLCLLPSSSCSNWTTINDCSLVPRILFLTLSVHHKLWTFAPFITQVKSLCSLSLVLAVYYHNRCHFGGVFLAVSASLGLVASVHTHRRHCCVLPAVPLLFVTFRYTRSAPSLIVTQSNNSTDRLRACSRGCCSLCWRICNRGRRRSDRAFDGRRFQIETDWTFGHLPARKRSFRILIQIRWVCERPF